ncbi:hypothetical protein PMAYCL1PPCAC_09715, partial [Pristionchus mayeri]
RMSPLSFSLLLVVAALATAKVVDNRVSTYEEPTIRLCGSQLLEFFLDQIKQGTEWWCTPASCRAEGMSGRMEGHTQQLSSVCCVDECTPKQARQFCCNRLA